jgi:hypothetical protein
MKPAAPVTSTGREAGMAGSSGARRETRDGARRPYGEGRER